MKTKHSCVIYLALMAGLAMPAFCQDPNTLKLKDFNPVSIYKIPQTKIEKAKYPAIDMHSHDYPKSDALVQEWMRTMKEANIEKTLILSYATGARFDSVVAKYGRYKDKFEIWCGFDYTGIDKPGWQEHAVAELERCYKKGAKGVGELGDKGLGEFYSTPVPGYGLHIDDPRMKPLLEKCAQLHMPVNVHVAEDEWMYLNPDSTNDGLMNSAKWHVDMTKPGIINHDQLVATLENAVKNNPATTFIASVARIGTSSEDCWIPIPTFTLILRPGTAKFLPFPDTAMTLLKNTRTGLFMVPTWDRIRKCTVSPSPFWKRPTNISMSATCLVITGRCTDSPSAMQR